jgi:hypothetical protein
MPRTDKTNTNNMTEPPLLFINVPWMKRYEGASESDKPTGDFKYTREHQMDDHCQFNFQRFRGKVYGQAPGSTNPNLMKLGGARSEPFVNGVMVVWIATDPESRGRVIVGWCENATVWKTRQTPTGELAEQRTTPKSRDCCQFSAEASADDAVCLLPGRRPRLNVDDGRPGQNPFWYGSRTANKQVFGLLANSRRKQPQQNVSLIGGRGGWIQNPVERQKIELNAMDVVLRYYSENGYEVQDKSSENLGYDLLARSEAVELHLEVKGTKGNTVCVELTPNEFSFAKKHLSTFRLCVVLDALNDGTLRIFRPGRMATEWQDESGNSIQTIEKTGALIRE